MTIRSTSSYMESSVVTIRLDADLERELDALAASTGPYLLSDLRHGTFATVPHHTDLSLDAPNHVRVDAHPDALGCEREVSVEARVHAQKEAARIRPLRLLPELRTPREIVVDGVRERLLESLDRRRLERDRVTQADDLTVEDLGVRVERDLGAVPLVRHGVAPVCSSSIASTSSQPSEAGGGVANTLTNV